jgi:hypothetical protein
MSLIKRKSFNDVRYKDQGHLHDEDVFWSEELPPLSERFKEKPVRTEGNYLYTDENADRFNADKDYNQQHGQPKGVDSTSKSPLQRFDSNTSSDQAKRVFEGNLISTFNNEEKLVSDILKECGGSYGIE